MQRKIEIVQSADNYYAVHEGDRYCDALCWDEMLGQVARLTLNQPCFPMRTKEEHDAIERNRQERMAHPYDEAEVISPYPIPIRSLLQPSDDDPWPGIGDVWQHREHGYRLHVLGRSAQPLPYPQKSGKCNDVLVLYRMEGWGDETMPWAMEIDRFRLEHELVERPAAV